MICLGKQGGLGEGNVHHDQKVGSNPPSVGVLRPWAGFLISSCFTPPSVIIGSCYRDNHDLTYLRVTASVADLIKWK